MEGKVQTSIHLFTHLFKKYLSPSSLIGVGHPVIRRRNRMPSFTDYGRERPEQQMIDQR